jgi:hypothetical protein
MISMALKSDTWHVLKYSFLNGSCESGSTSAAGSLTIDALWANALTDDAGSIFI